MSEVRRWKFKGWIGSFVTSEEFDKLSDALSENTKAWHRTADNFYKDSERHKQEMAALREELANVKGLLRSASVDYACCLEAGYDRITSLGGGCDSVEKMLADNSNYARYKAALAKPTESGASE